MKKRLYLNFKDYKDSELNRLALDVIAKMTGNKNFPDPGSLLNDLQNVSNQYFIALSDAWSRDMEKIALKNQLRRLLLKTLKQLALYVTLVAKGDEIVLLSSGFPITQPKGETVLPQPRDFKVSPGPNYGEIILKVKRVPGAKSYLYRYTPDPMTKESVWENIIGTRCKKIIKGLPLGNKIWFQMAAIGSNDQIVYTEPKWRYIS